MKRIIAAATVAVLLTGCDIERQPGSGKAPGGFRTQPVEVWVDPDTSCEYLISIKDHITPRMHSDGHQVCLGQDTLGQGK